MESFIKYARGQSKDAGNEDDDKYNDNVLDSSGPIHVDAQMGDQTTGQSGSQRYPLRSRNKTSSIHPKEGRLADLMSGMCALWMQSLRVDKPKPEDDHASSLIRNENVKIWLHDKLDHFSVQRCVLIINGLVDQEKTRTWSKGTSVNVVFY